MIDRKRQSQRLWVGAITRKPIASHRCGLGICTIGLRATPGRRNATINFTRAAAAAVFSACAGLVIAATLARARPDLSQLRARAAP
jgi:hypothetical protein